MKRIYTILVSMAIGIFLTASVFLPRQASAQAPEKMSYQAVIRNSSDVLVTDTQVGMQISILQGSASGTAVYVETQTPTTNENGLVSIEIGNGTVQSGDFSTIDWANGNYFIKTETDPAGGTNYTITGTSQLLSVPYALHAKTAETVTGGITETDPAYTSSQAANITAADITNLGNLSGTNTGDQDLGGLATTTAVTTGLDGKVDKVSGKGLSTEDYTTAEKTKLAGIATGAEVNVNADWNASSGDGQIINKPTTLSGYGINDGVNTTVNQTIAGNKTFTGTTTVANPVNATDAATKAYVDALLVKIEALEESDLLNNGFTDPRDDNHYDVVKIGNQIWMAENLKYLPTVAGPGTGSETTPYYYVYDYDGTNVADAKATANYTTYGVLYNWPAAMNGQASSTSNPSGLQGVCPTGWHLPSDAEWSELTTYLGGESVAGGKLKETVTTHWNSPNTGATNETGFTALPGGYRHSGGTFGSIGDYGNWWSATEYGTSTAWYRTMSYLDSSVYRYDSTKELGFSVRCVRD